MVNLAAATPKRLLRLEPRKQIRERRTSCGASAESTLRRVTRSLMRVTRFFSSSQSSVRNTAREAGIALVLVMFVIALASILVINLAYSTYIGARINAGVERSLQAEYLLKSALNLARVLIKADDSPNGPWAMFQGGTGVPLELIGINEPNIGIELEIRSEGSKIPLAQITAGPFTKWRDVLERVMDRELHFNADQEEDQSGYFPKRVFTTKELVANLIDYQSDPSLPAYDQDGYRGIKGDSSLPDGVLKGSKIVRVSELAAIPGFTPKRVQLLMPLVTVIGTKSKIDINTAPPEILRSLDADPTTGQQIADAIIGFREDKEKGPFKDQVSATLQTLGLSSTLADSLGSLLQVDSSRFQVIAKVDYSTSRYFMRAYLDRSQDPSGIPAVTSFEIF